MIVAKFGGGVLDGAEGLRRVAGEILGLSRPALVVVSAFAQVTNRLERLAEAAVSRQHDPWSLLEELVAMHRAIADQVLDPMSLERWRSDAEPIERRLEEVVKGLAIMGELSPRTLDLVVSAGERLSSALVMGALRSAGLSHVRGVPATDVIITDDKHRYARPDMELTRERVEARMRPALEGDAVAVTEGYIARGIAGEITTMGRESSDYSATLLGQLLGADEVRIYTAVPGILTADPEVIAGARTLPHLGYGAARTLAELGAKVLHPRTVGPVEASGIPLVIRPLDGTGTRIGGSPGGDADIDASIVLLPSASLASIELPAASAAIDPFLNAVAARVPIVWHSRFRRRLQVVVFGELPLRDLLPGHFQGRANGVVRAGSVVSLVRQSGLRSSALAAFFGVLGEAEPLAILGGIDRRAVSVVVEPEDALKLVAALHRQFVELRDDDSEREPVSAPQEEPDR